MTARGVVPLASERSLAFNVTCKQYARKATKIWASMRGEPVRNFVCEA
jgi:hypothetical protein